MNGVPPWGLPKISTSVGRIVLPIFGGACGVVHAGEDGQAVFLGLDVGIPFLTCSPAYLRQKTWRTKPQADWVLSIYPI